MSIKPSFQGEIQFRRYSDTSTQGQQIVFAVADREALSPFIGSEGKRYMAVLVEIGDDEMPVQPPPRKDTRGPLCREACDLCAMVEFQRWLNEGDTPPPSEDRAKARILKVCAITSRKEIDTNEQAKAIFINAFRLPFMRYMKTQRQAA